ncbi:ABC transporter substrate-binding protein [Chromobacterium sp. CV08]|uniref:ABC transporter substrate-binding protein n=1 Tax=Chromobacterium sp. CV08 TaxID=3133274 RepID=UPI003DA884BF
MPRPDTASWCREIAAAAERRDWATLAALDARLRARLSAPDCDLTPEDRAALGAAYRSALAQSQGELDELQHRLAGLGRQREGQLAYAQFSEWEQA